MIHLCVPGWATIIGDAFVVLDLQKNITIKDFGVCNYSLYFTFNSVIAPPEDICIDQAMCDNTPVLLRLLGRAVHFKDIEIKFSKRKTSQGTMWKQVFHEMLDEKLHRLLPISNI